MRIAIVVSRFNDFVTDRLLAGAQERCASRASPTRTSSCCACRARSRFPWPRSASPRPGGSPPSICLGCLIKGATPHFEYIASACAHGITAAAAATGVPMAFGVLTTNSVEEALERAVVWRRQQGPRSRAGRARDGPALSERRRPVMTRRLADPAHAGKAAARRAKRRCRCSITPRWAAVSSDGRRQQPPGRGRRRGDGAR